MNSTFHITCSAKKPIINHFIFFIGKLAPRENKGKIYIIFYLFKSP